MAHFHVSIVSQYPITNLHEACPSRLPGRPSAFEVTFHALDGKVTQLHSKFATQKWADAAAVTDAILAIIGKQ